MQSTVLIVEDEPDLLHTLEYNIKREGYLTRSASNAQDALDILNEHSLPALILLDLMLPDMSGKEVCRRVRECERTHHIPIIMLTAKGEEVDRISGFEAGADDYIVKPFSVRELLLRIRAVLSRTRRATASASRPEAAEEFGILRLDSAGHQLWVKGEEIKLTALEFKLLSTLFSRKGQVQSREVLLHDVWDIEADIMTRTVDTHIKRLREKLGEAGDYIETLRGVGYRFRASVQ